MLAERPPRRLELLDQIRDAKERGGGLIEAFVPISLINREDVAVDEAHVQELAESMRQEAKEGKGNGQLSPVILGQVPGLDQFAIIDGFHRVAALDQTGEKEVFSTVKPNITWEEVINHRILAAATHRYVRFARLGEWIRDSWTRTPWSEKINVSQAFLLRSGPSMTGSRMRLSPEEVNEIRVWVNKKCEQWHLSAGHIYANILLVAQTVDPELVKKARERKGGWLLEALTPLHLKELSLVLPGRFDLQNVVAETAIREALTISATRAVAEAVSRVNTVEEAKEIINSLKERGLLDFNQPKREREDYDKLLEDFFQAEVKIAQLTIQNAILRGRYKPDKENPLRPNPNGDWVSVKRLVPSISESERVPLILSRMFDLPDQTIAVITGLPLERISISLRKLDQIEKAQS